MADVTSYFNQAFNEYVGDYSLTLAPEPSFWGLFDDEESKSSLFFLMSMIPVAARDEEGIPCPQHVLSVAV